MSTDFTSTASQIGDTVQQAAQTAVDTMSTVYDRGAATASQVSSGVTQFRALVRHQPVTMGFVMLALGYMLGTQLRR